jgi:hypothetical protein
MAALYVRERVDKVGLPAIRALDAVLCSRNGRRENRRRTLILAGALESTEFPRPGSIASAACGPTVNVACKLVSFRPDRASERLHNRKVETRAPAVVAVTARSTPEAVAQPESTVVLIPSPAATYTYSVGAKGGGRR